MSEAYAVARTPVKPTGLFVGPVVLAVTYTLLNAWVSGETSAVDEAVTMDAERS